MAVRHGSPSETASAQHGVQLHLFRLQPGLFHRGVAVHGLKLRPCPNLATVLAHVGHAVHRLHRRVREIRQIVYGFELFGGIAQCIRGVAFFPRDRSGPFRQFGVLLALRPAVERGQLAVVPGNFQRLTSELGGPETVRHHRHAAIDLNDVPNTRNGLCFVSVEAFHLAPEDRRSRDHRDEHSRHVHVEAEYRFAVGLVGCVQSLRRFAHEFEVFRVFHRDVFWRVEFGCFLRQASVGRALVGWGNHMTVFRATVRRLDFPRVRSGGDQHLPRHRAGFAQALPLRPGARTPAGDLHAEQGVVVGRVNRRGFIAHLAPIGIQFFGDNHRYAGVRALPHLRMIHHDRDGFVRADPDKGIERDGRPRLVCGLNRVKKLRNVNAQNQSAPCQRAGLKKTAAAAIDDGAHLAPPCVFNCAAR